MHKNRKHSHITMINRVFSSNRKKNTHTFIFTRVNRNLTINKTRELLLGLHVLLRGCQLPRQPSYNCQSVAFWLVNTHEIVQFTRCSLATALVHTFSLLFLFICILKHIKKRIHAERNKIFNKKKLFSVFKTRHLK